MSYVGLSKGAQNDTYWPPGGVPESILRSDMLVHWVKVTWAKDGGSGTQWGPAIFFSEKKSTSLNPMRLSHSILSPKLELSLKAETKANSNSALLAFLHSLMGGHVMCHDLHDLNDLLVLHNLHEVLNLHL